MIAFTLVEYSKMDESFLFLYHYISRSYIFVSAIYSLFFMTFTMKQRIIQMPTSKLCQNKWASVSVFGRFITVNSAVLYWILYITPDLPTRYRRYLGVLDSWRQPKLYDGLTLFHFYVKRIHLVLIFRWMKWKYNSKWR